MALVNGAEGIGTGWSTFIPCHNPRSVVENIKRLMRNEPYVPMHPWYKGYFGDITEIDGKHMVTGVYKILAEDELEISELPIGKWTRDYKNFLEELAQKDIVEEIREYHQENRVHFVLKVPKLILIEKTEGIVKKFKLQTSLSGSNYVLFNDKGQIHKYATEADIMKEWFDLRVQLYDKRKEHMLARLRKDYEMLKNK